MMILQQTRGALSSGDQLALDLPFAATKSLAARIGPTPTFTRGSGATYVGSDGLLHGVDTSTTSNTIGTGSKTFTLAATAGQDQLYRTGDAVDASNGSNSMVGTVTSYTPSTQVLVCNITSVTGSGTFTSWRIGYRGPRFDHNPANPTICRGLLIEEGRTNLISQSENFASGTWFKTGVSPSSVANVEPDGSANSELFTEDTLSSTHRTFQSFTGTSGTVYTLSVFLKFAGRQYVFLENRSITNNPYVVFDIQNGTVFSTIGALTSTIQAYPNGWYRCSVTGTANAAGGNWLIGGYSGGSQSYTGSGGPAFYAWGAQVEAGSFPTSYIPTTTGALARSADVCSITGANFTNLWNQLEGTLLSQTQKASTNANAFVISASDGSFNNETDLRYNSVSQIAALINVSNAPQVSGFQANITSGAAVKSSIAYKLNDCAYAANGASPILDTSALIPTVDRLTIGNVAVAGNNFYLNGTIAAIRYYKKRLPNAKLQALTA